jgi:hypothetical protein
VLCFGERSRERGRRTGKFSRRSFGGSWILCSRGRVVATYFINKITFSEGKGERGTKSVRGGKKSGGEAFSRPWYALVLWTSYCPYFAFAGRVQGGLFPRVGLVGEVRWGKGGRTDRSLRLRRRGRWGGICVCYFSRRRQGGKGTYSTVTSWEARRSLFLRR